MFDAQIWDSDFTRCERMFSHYRDKSWPNYQIVFPVKKYLWWQKKILRDDPRAVISFTVFYALIAYICHAYGHL